MPARIALSLFFLASTALGHDWERVGPGVDYARFSPNPPFVYHVTRVDMTEEKIQVFVTPESQRGAKVSEVADRFDALAAVNGDYFDENLRPIGFTAGACGTWKSRGAPTQRREVALAVGEGRVAVLPPSADDPELPAWTRHAISGWPTLVRDCEALSAKELPGSDGFTRSPHYRTAAGTSKDGKTLYLVVAAGKQGEAAGVTLAELGHFMRESLGVCSAVNLDGGGSSVMAVNEKLVEAPKNGEERKVGNHLVVALDEDYPKCESGDSSPVASEIPARQVWEEISEAMGRDGVLKGGKYRMTGEPVVAGRASWFTFSRVKGLVNVEGLVAVAPPDAERVAAALKEHGFTIRSRRERSARLAELRFHGRKPLYEMTTALRAVLK